MSEFDKLELKNKDGEIVLRIETPVGSISPVKVVTTYQKISDDVSATRRHTIRNEDLEGFAVCILSVLGYKIR